MKHWTVEDESDEAGDGTASNSSSTGRVTNAVRVQAELRRAILAGTLTPGQRLRADALARQLATSRTPVREALLSLAREGLVEILPRRGAIVSSFDPSDLMDRYEVKKLVEPRITARAAMRISPEAIAALERICATSEALGMDESDVVQQVRLNEGFHRTIAQEADAPKLVAAISAVGAIPTAFASRFWENEDQREQAQFCHRQITAALTRRNAPLAEAVMRMHIIGSMEFLTQVASVSFDGSA